MRLNSLLNESKVASTAGQFEQSRVAAQSSLRLTNDPQLRAEALKYLQTAYGALAAYRLPQFNTISLVKQVPDTVADNLLLLGLYDEALPELLAARKTSAGPDEDYSIAVLSLRAGIPNGAVRFGEQIWKSMPPDYVIELAPRELVELLY